MIRYAVDNDFELLGKYDKHISATELRNCIKAKKVLIVFNEGVFIGWLRFNLFWDSVPFMNMLYILEEYRGKRYGSQLVDFWENEMLKSNYKIVLTSTQSNEQAQFFIEK